MNIHAIVPEGETLDHIRYSKGSVERVLVDGDCELIDQCFLWSATKQGYFFWSYFYAGDNKEEGMAILKDFLYGGTTFNEEDVWE